jgi:hypothetical protein
MRPHNPSDEQQFLGKQMRAFFDNLHVLRTTEIFRGGTA